MRTLSFTPSSRWCRIGGVLLAWSALSALSYGAATWDGGGAANDNWDYSSGAGIYDNWDDNNLPATTADVTFASAFGVGGTSISLNGDRTANSLTINTGTAFSIANSTLALTSGNIMVSVDGNHDFNSAMNIGSTAAVWDITGTQDNNGAHGLDVGGQITGSGSITKSGNGTLLLDATGGNPNFTGDMVVTGGRLTGRFKADQLKNAKSLTLTNATYFTSYPGNLGKGLITLDNASLQLNDTPQTVSNNILLNGTGTFTGNQPQTLSGTISGVGGLVFNGGPYLLTGLNSYTGQTTIKSGTTLQARSLADAGTSCSLGAPTGGNATISMVDGTLKYAGTDPSGHSTNRPLASGGGRGWLDASGAGPVSFTGGYSNGSRDLTLQGSGRGLLQGISMGTGYLTKDGTGTWTVSGTCTYSGVTTITQGKLIMNTTLALSASAITVASGATLGGNGTLHRPVTSNGGTVSARAAASIP